MNGYVLPLDSVIILIPGWLLIEYGWWYLTDGEIDWDYTGMACNEYGWWYMNNGALDLSYTGDC